MILIYIAVCIGVHRLLPAGAAKRVQPRHAPDLPGARRDRLLLPALLPVQGLAREPARLRQLGRDRLDGARAPSSMLGFVSGAAAPSTTPTGSSSTTSRRQRRRRRRRGASHGGRDRRTKPSPATGHLGVRPRPRAGRSRSSRARSSASRRTTASRGQIRIRGRSRHGDRLRADQQRHGPVAVKGAEPGDSLVAELLEVNPIEWGVATIIPGYGQLHEQVRSPVTKIFDVKDGWIQMDERIRFPMRPMVGVVGVATEGETLTNALPGRARRQPRQPPARARARRSTSRCASRAACSRSATCTRRWATARSAAPASRSPARWSSASTS